MGLAGMSVIGAISEGKRWKRWKRMVRKKYCERERARAMEQGAGYLASNMPLLLGSGEKT